MLDEVARSQGGVVTRAQAFACGLSRAAVEANLTSGRWRRVFPGVYATFTGPLPRDSLMWAAVLKAGHGAVLSHESAAELAGLADRPSPAIHVTVPTRRTPQRIPGVVVHRSDRAITDRHPTRLPPQTRVEETVVDLTQAARRLDDAIGWLARAVGARVTTVDRLAAAVRRRRKLRWRPMLCAALEDVKAGCESLLELKYFRDVERDHGLPRGERQVRVVRDSGVVYHDVVYRKYGTRVELDGQAAHPEEARFRDMRRDNATVLEGDVPLRYGLADVVPRPCSVAAEVSEVLRGGGWRGRPRRCRRPRCVIP